MMRRGFIGILVILGFSVSSGQSHAAVGERPNLVFILADDLGYGDLGCYGQRRIRTPNLDRLAADGIRFTQFYAGSTVCAPSRCTLMTGLHTGHARVRGNGLVPLAPNDVTVAEVLKSAGYATGIFGKWGLGEPGTTGLPNRQGFDAWFGYLNQVHAHNYYPDYLWENETRVALPGNRDGMKQEYAPNLFTERAIEFVRQRKGGPFFLYLAYNLPHANNELQRATGNGMEVPSDEPYHNEPWPGPQRNHAAMITWLDTEIGKVLTAIDALGLAQNTVVFFSSDNGPHKEGGADPAFFQSAGPLRGHKRDLYEGGIRAPFIVRWAGHIEPGRASDHAGAFWDFLPTAAELAGAKTPSGLDGISIVPELLGDDSREQPEHDCLYWEFHERGFQQALRKGPWKLIRLKMDETPELYDLRTDVGERTNVAADYPDVVAELSRKLDAARTESPDWPIKTARAR